MKKNTIIALTIIGVLLVATIGATFAYFASSNQNDGNDASLNQTTEELGSILLDGTKAFTSYDLLPGQIGIQEFTIEKDSESGRGIYELDLAATVPEEFRSDIEILLYKTTEPDTNNVAVNVADPTLENNQIYQEDSLNITGSPELVYQGVLTENPQIILEQADFDVATLEKTTYYLVYHYKNNGNQDDQQGKTFTGTISVRLINEKLPTFADTILACNDTAANCIKENASLSNEIATDDPDNNARYIGADPNNYVDLGERYPEGTLTGKWEDTVIYASTVEECRTRADSYFSCDNWEIMGYSSEAECQEETSSSLYDSYNVSNIEEFKNIYCVQEDISNQPMLWRIIGVFNNIDDGTGKKETRLKIMRGEPYSTEIVWDKGNQNDWSTASLQEELNTTYLNSIQSPYKEMIGNTVWNLGGSRTDDDVTASMFYERERSTETFGENPSQWTGKIGLIYPSDYGYSTNGGNVGRNNCINMPLYQWRYNQECGYASWMYSLSSETWTLTSFATEADMVFSFYGSDSDDITSLVGSEYVGRLESALPTLYLSSNVKIIGGDGSESNPFTLSL